MKKLIILILISGFSFGDSIYIGMKTDHPFSPKSYNLNENNDVLIIEHNGLLVGRMINSYDDESFIVGVEKYTKHFSYGAILATGYKLKNKNGKILLPVVFIKKDIPVTNNISITGISTGLVTSFGVEIRAIR